MLPPLQIERDERQGLREYVAEEVGHHYQDVGPPKDLPALGSNTWSKALHIRKSQSLPAAVGRPGFELRYAWNRMFQTQQPNDSQSLPAIFGAQPQPQQPISAFPFANPVFPFATPRYHDRDGKVSFLPPWAVRLPLGVAASADTFKDMDAIESYLRGLEVMYHKPTHSVLVTSPNPPPNGTGTPRRCETSAMLKFSVWQATLVLMDWAEAMHTSKMAIPLCDFLERDCTRALKQGDERGLASWYFNQWSKLYGDDYIRGTALNNPRGDVRNPQPAERALVDHHVSRFQFLASMPFNPRNLDNDFECLSQEAERRLDRYFPHVPRACYREVASEFALIMHKTLFEESMAIDDPENPAYRWIKAVGAGLDPSGSLESKHERARSQFMAAFDSEQR